MTNESPARWVTGKNQELEWMMRMVGRMHYERVRAEMAVRGLADVSHPRLLFLLLDQPDRTFTSQKELADFLGVRSASVAVSLKRMEAHDLLRRIPDEHDSRKNRIALTDKGRERILACIAAFKELDNGMFRGFSGQERRQLTQYYQRIIQNLVEMGATPPFTIPQRQEGAD